jgi:hypothetical protein
MPAAACSVSILRAAMSWPRPRLFTGIVFALAAALAVLPSLRVLCETACSRSARAAVAADQAASRHCAANVKQADADQRDPRAPKPDTCGHRSDFALVKKAVEPANPGFTGLATVPGFVLMCERASGPSLVEELIPPARAVPRSFARSSSALRL